MVQFTPRKLPSCHLHFAIFLLLNLVALSYGNAIRITPAPSEPTYQAELFKRQIDTWGYISGNSNSPVTCPASFTRTYDGVAANFLACCNAVTCHNNWHLCVPYGGTGCPYPSICSEIYTSYTSCGQALPGCETYFLPTVPGVGATQGITSYDCGPTETLIHLLSTITGGQAVATGASTGSSSTSVGQGVATYSDTSAGATAQITSDLASSSQSTSNPNSSNPSSSSHQLSTGEIVGIAIGGLIGVIILGFVVWGCFLCLRSCFGKCCGDSRKPGGSSSYAGTNYEMDRVAQWRDNQAR